MNSNVDILGLDFGNTTAAAVAIRAAEASGNCSVTPFLNSTVVLVTDLLFAVCPEFASAEGPPPGTPRSSPGAMANATRALAYMIVDAGQFMRASIAEIDYQQHYSVIITDLLADGPSRSDSGSGLPDFAPHTTLRVRGSCCMLHAARASPCARFPPFG